MNVPRVIYSCVFVLMFNMYIKDFRDIWFHSERCKDEAEGEEESKLRKKKHRQTQMIVEESVKGCIIRRVRISFYVCDFVVCILV